MAWKAEAFQLTVQYGTHDRTRKGQVHFPELNSVVGTGILKYVVVKVYRRKSSSPRDFSQFPVFDRSLFTIEVFLIDTLEISPFL